MNRLTLSLAITLMALPLVPALAAPAWEMSAATLPASQLKLGATVVPDPAASGGQAVRMPYAKGQRGYCLGFSAPKMTAVGKVWFTFYLRGEGWPPLPTRCGLP
jgi:hypothetical protein